MPKEPRIHHYIPQLYLRGFGWKRGKNWHVYAADLKNSRFIQPNTKNICAERDFLRMEIEGHPPDILEKEMGKFEARARETILRVAEAKKFEGEDRNMVLNFIALLAVRHPLMRENMRQFQERTMKMMVDLMLAKEERWESQMRRMREQGKVPEHEITYKDIKEFHDKDQYRIEVAREYHIGTEFKMFEPVLETLGHRKWKLFYPGEGQGHFVTSDNPVVLTWDHPEELPYMMRHSPGFGMTRTEVTFPLTRDCYLLGRFEDMDDGVEEVSAHYIARCNTRMISHAHDYVITSSKSFPYLIPPYQPYWDDRFMERIKEYREINPQLEERAVE